MNDNRSAYNSDIYDSNIVSTLPYYREYHNQITDLVRAMGLRDIDWLDMGCGTGTLAKRVFEERDDVRFTLCDPSEQMLSVAREKLTGRDIRFLNVPSQDLTFDSEFDVVTAVQSHHYLKADERRKAVGNCFRALRENGVLVTFENIRLLREAGF